MIRRVCSACLIGLAAVLIISGCSSDSEKPYLPPPDWAYLEYRAENVREISRAAFAEKRAELHIHYTRTDDDAEWMFSRRQEPDRIAELKRIGRVRLLPGGSAPPVEAECKFVEAAPFVAWFTDEEIKPLKTIDRIGAAPGVLIVAGKTDSGAIAQAIEDISELDLEQIKWLGRVIVLKTPPEQRDLAGRVVGEFPCVVADDRAKLELLMLPK